MNIEQLRNENEKLKKENKYLKQRIQDYIKLTEKLNKKKEPVIDPELTETAETVQYKYICASCKFQTNDSKTWRGHFVSNQHVYSKYLF